MSASLPERREIAHGLASALGAALAAGAPPIALLAARDVAQIMDFPGLEAALAELARHPGPRRPAEIEHLAERIGRLIADAIRDGDIAVFAGADRELGALAAQLENTEWSRVAPAGGPAVATLRADEALADLTLEAMPEAAAARMTMTVASAVRAAIDWLGAEESPRVTLESHDSALTISVTATHDGGIGPAGAVLAAADGSLGREVDGRWTLRVAASVERPSFLLLRQGRFGVAIPWHSVARLRMFPPHELERLDEPVLPPLSTPAEAALERPCALVALGLVRAWFVADRIVWRIASTSREADSPAPFAGGSRIVEVDNGERYWVLEPAWLLRGIAPPDVAPPSPRPRVSTTTLEALPPPPEPTGPAIPAPSPEGEPLAEAVERALAALRPARPAQPTGPAAPPEPTAGPALAAPDAEAVPPAEGFDAAFDAAFAPVRSLEPQFPAAAPAPHETTGLRPSELAARTPQRRALVADDSLVARIFLGRLLERRGWVVQLVGDAATLWDELPRGPWDLVCADIALPDAQGAGHVRRLLDYLCHRASPIPLVVLTRDADDDRLARETGATQLLRKPVDHTRLDSLLPR